jgi:hypothetical protein
MHLNDKQSIKIEGCGIGTPNLKFENYELFESIDDTPRSSHCYAAATMVIKDLDWQNKHLIAPLKFAALLDLVFLSLVGEERLQELCSLFASHPQS